MGAVGMELVVLLSVVTASVAFTLGEAVLEKAGK
jgi:hypothetical protein